MARPRPRSPNAPILSRAQINYQVDRHLRAQAAQWPDISIDAMRRRTRRSVANGMAWLWPVPYQLDLFAGEEGE